MSDFCFGKEVELPTVKSMNATRLSKMGRTGQVAVVEVTCWRNP